MDGDTLRGGSSGLRTEFNSAAGFNAAHDAGEAAASAQGIAGKDGICNG